MSTSSRWRRARDFVVGLTMLVVLAWALPRVDTSDGMRALSTIVIGVTGSAVWAVHEQRILRRSPRQQARVALEMMAAGAPLYGAFPPDNPHGDTYGPALYAAYVPFEQLFPWSGAWDDLPAAHAAAVQSAADPALPNEEKL